MFQSVRSAEISLVIPLLNEETNIREIYRQLCEVLEPKKISFEILFIDDGSQDGSVAAIEALIQKDPRVCLISFSRNFGHQAALTAGLDHAQGKAVITLDADLQHPIYLIPQLIEKWREGFPIVITVRKNTLGASFFKRWSAKWFYQLLSFLSDLPAEEGAADFRLMDRVVVEAFKSFDERVRYLRGLTAWMGFKTARLEYTADPRYSGNSKYSTRKMIRLAIEGITSFSTVPLKLVATVGFFLTLAGVGYGVWALYARFVLQLAVPGWTSTVLLILLVGGIQIGSIGLLGIYIGKIFEEVKRRPKYIVARTLGGESAPDV